MKPTKLPRRRRVAPKLLGCKGWAALEQELEVWKAGNPGLTYYYTKAPRIYDSVITWLYLVIGPAYRDTECFDRAVLEITTMRVGKELHLQLQPAMSYDGWTAVQNRVEARGALRQALRRLQGRRDFQLV